jgi:hypothetical protein
MAVVEDAPSMSVNPVTTSGPAKYESNGTETNDRRALHEDVFLSSQIRELFMRARDKRRPLVSQWNKNYRMLKNRMWTDARPAYMPKPEITEIFPIIASFVGWMTDQRPLWNITPWSLPHSPYYNLISTLGNDLSTIMRARWEDDDIETEMEKVLWDSQIYGIGIGKVGWDETESLNLGDVVIRRVDPYTFYPDPQASNMKDANYFIEARTYSLQELDRRFPGAAKLFHGGLEEDVDAVQTQTGQTREEMPMANPGAISPVTTPRYSKYGQSRLDGANIDDAGVTVFECWMREHEIDNDNVAHDGWRVVIVAGNIILLDELAEDLWEHASHPYERYVPYDLGEFFGISLVELLISPQESINRILAALQYNVELLGNPVFKESTRSGLQRTQITNKPGQRITVNDAGEAGWMNPPPLHPMIPELIRYFLQRMEAISGLSSITRGGQATGRNAATVIDAMQEASFVRIRMALRNHERFVRRLGTKAAGLIVENYTEPRMIAYVGHDGAKSVAALQAEHFYLPTNSGTDMPLKFRLNVDVGSQTQTSREARESKAMALFGMGAIDDMALLEAVDFPNREIVHKRVLEMKAAGMFQPPGARQRTRS